jgi:hypothetical protein
MSIDYWADVHQDLADSIAAVSSQLDSFLDENPLATG